MLDFASAFLKVLVLVVINAFAVRWVLSSATLSREPAFAAFCFAVAVAFGSIESMSNDNPDGPIASLGALLGGGLGLWLFWRRAVRPERAARTD